MADKLQFDLAVSYETLKQLKEELSKAKAQLDKLIIGTAEFAKQEKTVYGLNQRIKDLTSLTAAAVKEKERMSIAQERETAALQKHLGQMDARAQKEANVEAAIYSARQKNIQAMEVLSQKQIAVQRATLGLTTGAANAGVALQNLNFVIRDSPYFFRDFSLGLLAVGNNLNPLIDSMLRMKREAQDVGQTLSGALWASLKGPAGVVLAFSALVTVLQAVTFAMSSTKKEAKETKDEIRELRDELQKLTREQLQSGLVRAKTEFQAELFNVPDVQRRQMLLGRIPMTDELKRLDERIKAYEKEIFMLGDIENVENRLRINRQRLKDLNKDNLALYKDVATTYDDIKNKLESWIKADEKSLKVTKEKNKELQYGIAISREAESRRITFFGEAIGTGQWERQNLPQPESRKIIPEKGRTLADNFKETNKELRQSIDIAREFGDALSEAFMQGKNALDIFRDAMISLMLKMAAAKFFSFLAGLATGGAAVAVPAIAGAMSKPSLGGGLDINVTGELSAKQDKFIIEFDRAKNKVYNSRRLDFVN